MNNRTFAFVVTLFAIGIFTLAQVLSSGANIIQAQTLTYTSNDLFIEENGGEYKIPESVCLTDAKRHEIQEKIRENIAKLHSHGKIADSSQLFVAPQFIFPVRGNGAAINDPGVHGISNFVDHNFGFPGQLRDYTCGTRTYDTAAGYNHKGIDIFSYPFSWNKMDNNEAAIVAAADGVIVYKNDGNGDRSCSFNNNNWNAVYVHHADATVSWYGHMKRNSLTSKGVGEAVAQGEFLGIVGSSGNSTGPHLHFEIYNPAGQLQDPFQGTCNLMNNFSYWANQPEYRDSKINRLMTHSAPPSFSGCPNPEVPNEKTLFKPGEILIVAAYYRDQQIGQQTQYSLIQPNGAVYSNWTHNSPNTYTASYWYWTFTLPGNAMAGNWKFRANFQSSVYEQSFTIQGKGKAPFDFDGDSKTDISIYRVAGGEWWYLRSSDGGNRAFQFGSVADKIVPADYTGDGKTDVAFFRPATSEWFVLRSEDSSFYSFPFGAVGDVPTPADFDGDGKADPAVFRPSTATWFIARSSGGTTIQQFGAAGDAPVLGDYDGDGKADLAIYRTAAGEWWYLRSSDGGNRAFQFGTSLDKPVQADYTGDGKTDVAFFRPAKAEWFVLRSENGSFYSAPFGAPADIPIPGDYDGDGKVDLALWRESDRNWYVAKSSGGFSISAFGSVGDKPVPSAFVP